MQAQRERSRKETFISTTAGPAHEGSADCEFVATRAMSWTPR